MKGFDGHILQAYTLAIFKHDRRRLFAAVVHNREAIDRHIFGIRDLNRLLAILCTDN
jgi:hypothetical protein